VESFDSDDLGKAHGITSISTCMLLAARSHFVLLSDFFRRAVFTIAPFSKSALLTFPLVTFVSFSWVTSLFSSIVATAFL
jgi:hypothetical protein